MPKTPLEVEVRKGPTLRHRRPARAHRRALWSETVTEAAVVRALERLAAAADDWARLEPGGVLRFSWRRPPAR